jgi:tRNA/rRNA methyltransferase
MGSELPSNTCVVLVRTLYPSNIGSTARAMANMGTQRLILIDPQCERSASKAKMAAAAAQDILANAVEYNSLADFYAHEGQGLRIALTRRPGKRRELHPLPDTLAALVDSGHLQPSTPLYLIFGPEDNGLASEDLELVNRCAELPTFGANGSLNLSQAVLLALFLTQQLFKERWSNISMTETPQFTRLEFPDAVIREWIQSIGFNIEARKASAYLTVKRLLMQNLASPEDLHVLESILQQTVRKLKDPISS